MEAILGDEGLDLGQFGNLMDQGFGVRASQGVTTPAAGVRFTVDRLVNSFRWNNCPVRFAMPGLSPAFSLTRRSRGLPLHPHRIRRGRFGRVGGVEPESSLQVANARLQLGNPLLHGKKHRRDGGLSVRRDLTPKLIRNRQQVVHGAQIAPSCKFVNPRV
jgi:hypothetical protein